MTAIKERKALPHCSREESKRILELRGSVSALSKELAGIQLKYHSPITSDGDRKALAKKFDAAKQEISSTYAELLRRIMPVVEKAPETAADPAKVSDEARAAELHVFWHSFFEYPSASWKLANLCMKLGAFRENAGDQESAQSYYREAVLRCEAAANIVRGSTLGPKLKISRLIEIENLRFKAATKAEDEDELRQLSASRAIRMAFSVKRREAEQLPPNLSGLLSMYYGPELAQADMSTLLKTYFKLDEHSGKSRQKRDKPKD